jgi:MtN3 and saliva related transmembrane protein
MSTTLIGLCAGTLTTLSFVPQVVKCWRRRSVADLSLTMLLTFAIGVALWDLYGFMTQALPIILANSVTLVLAVALIVMKASYEERLEERRDRRGGPIEDVRRKDAEVEHNRG